MESADRSEGTSDQPTASWGQDVWARIAAGVRRGGGSTWRIVRPGLVLGLRGGLWLLWLPVRLLRGWARDACDVFQRKGYLLIATLVAAYVGLYSVMEARHERQANRALFERANFMTMVASGNRGTFIAAMKTFGPVQTMTVPRDPELLDPRTWFAQERPNEGPLHAWVQAFSPLCMPETCGRPGAEGRWRIDLHGVDLHRADLSGADLGGADLSRANLSEANLSGASLTGADLSGAHFTGANLHRADLSWADLILADLSEANLEGAKLTSANLHRANLIGNNLTKVVSDMVNLSVAKLVGANLTEAYLDQANLRGANLTRANLRGAKLRGANFTWANLTKADFTGANLTWASVRRANLTEANLTGANLTKADFTGANLTWTKIAKANLTGADLWLVTSFTQEQLDTACVDDATQLPDLLTRPAPCPPLP